MFNCVFHDRNGTSYSLDHEWMPIRTFFGLIQAYKCNLCHTTISKKKFNENNYKVHQK
jgi:hypothetical protein